ncbi:MAG TPA: AGE family epimerase/isomerase, partial [Rectinemataceae bacterium]|nr:AGE family epimerase/isomerase [Rectinemataceae bacterium]
EPRWLELAAHGAAFIRDKGPSPSGDFYFALDRSGRPLVQPYNIFSDFFCAAGFAEYGKASGEAWATELAARTWRRILERRSRPKGVWTKQIAENRPVKAMGMSMMLLWMAEVMQGVAPREELEAIVSQSLDQIFSIHVDPGRRAVFERVFADGTRPDCMEGRLLNPGHALETLWFAMRAAERRADLELIERSREAMLWTIERGWDKSYGGIYYYQDYEGFPPEKLESDMKLWWVHVEALCAFLLAYKLTGDPVCEAWFHRIHDWTWSHFPDREHGEWYGYLDRRGEVAQSLKGGKWKGFFHLPRALMECSAWLAQMEASCAGDSYNAKQAGGGA